MSSKNEMRWVIATVITATVAITGCAAPEAPIERRGSSTSRLEKPKATLETPASAATKKQFGIDHWKIFRSNKDLFMTGYDENGKAVKGLTAGFGKSADDSESVVHTKINDGSSFTAVHGLTSNKTLANRAQSDDETEFMKAAFVDASKTNLAFRAAAGDSSSACGADLSAVLAQSLSCTQGKSKAAQAACVAAAKAAAESSTNCQAGGTTTPGASFDPNDPAYNPLSSIFDPAKFDIGKLGSLASQLGASYGDLGGDVFGMGEMGEVCADGATGDVGWGSGANLGALFDMAGGAGGGGWGEFECGAADWFGGGGGFDLGGYDMGGMGGW